MSTQQTPSPEHLHFLLARAERDALSEEVILRLKAILYFVEHGYSVPDTAKAFDVSRSTFHRWMERFNPDDLSTLADKSHEPLNVRQSAIDQATTELIRRYRMRYPQMGKKRISELLQRDHDTDISTSSVGRIIERECLYFADTPLHWRKRTEHQKNSSVPAAESGAPVATVSAAPMIKNDTTSMRTTSQKTWFTWQLIKRFIIVSSVITNIVFVSILLGMAFFEKKTAIQAKHPNIEYEQQEVLHAAPPQVYFP